MFDEVRESVYINQDTDTDLASIISENLLFERFMYCGFAIPAQNVGHFGWVFCYLCYTRFWVTKKRILLKL